MREATTHNGQTVPALLFRQSGLPGWTRTSNSTVVGLPLPLGYRKRRTSEPVRGVGTGPRPRMSGQGERSESASLQTFTLYTKHTIYSQKTCSEFSDMRIFVPSIGKVSVARPSLLALPSAPLDSVACSDGFSRSSLTRSLVFAFCSSRLFLNLILSHFPRNRATSFQIPE